MLVSVALFAIVMLIAGATLLSLVYANRKAEALQSVMNNLNISLDDMVRNIRMGSNYRCGTEAEPQSPQYGDCSSGGTSFYFTPYGASAGNSTEDVGYFVGGSCPSGRLCVTENVNGSVVTVPISAPEVQIQSLTFYVTGTTPGAAQPKVVVSIEGEAGTAQLNTQTTFDIQATAVQRLLNL